MISRYKDSIRHPVLQSPGSSSSTSIVQPLQWDLDDSLKQTIQSARKTFQSWADRLLIVSAETPVAKTLGPKYGVGNDAIMQMSIQLAHYKLHHTFVATYESASTAAFKHGRTETVRSCTNEAVAMCTNWLKEGTTTSE